MLRITQEFLDGLTETAVRSPRLRQSYDLRNSEHDGSQRMLNAMEPGTVLPIHRHRHTTETVVIVRGAVRQNLYDTDGTLTESIVLRPGSDCVAISTPAGQWHSSEALEHGTVIFEAKDGAYEPLSNEDILTV